MQDFQNDKETYLLLILSDSNLPTGSFVASAGLESTATHALFHAVPAPTGASESGIASCSTDSSNSNILAFLRNSVDTYAHSALPFARDAHRISAAYAKREIAELDDALAALARLDALYDASTLNGVARRASRAQGIALLTLYTKGLTRPAFLSASMMTPDGDGDDRASSGDDDADERDRESRAGALVAALKLRVRQGESDDALGHLPVCWGVLAGALGLDIDRGAHLHLFLHARGVISAAVRMNILGPYAAQQLLLHVVEPLLREALSSTAHLVSGALLRKEEDCPELPAEQLPATTWPLGEILSARHDLLHSRMFNS